MLPAYFSALCTGQDADTADDARYKPGENAACRIIKTVLIDKVLLALYERKGANTAGAVQYQPGKKAKVPILDVFGHVVSQQAREEVSCMHCSRRIAVCRHAPLPASSMQCT